MLGFRAAPLFPSRRQRTRSPNIVPHGVFLLGSNPPCRDFQYGTGLPRHNRHPACRRFFVLRSGTRRRGCRIAVLHSGFAGFGVGCGVAAIFLPAESFLQRALRILCYAAAQFLYSSFLL